VKRSIWMSLLVVVSLVTSLFGPVHMKVANAAYTNYYVGPVPTGTGDCMSWTNVCDLQTALNTVEATDRIYLLEGTYLPTEYAIAGDDRSRSFIFKSDGVSLSGGYYLTPDGTAFSDWQNHRTILSGDFNGDDEGFVNNEENAYHVVTATSMTSSTLIGSLFIQGGNANSTETDRGGGLSAQYASLELNNVVFINNHGSACAGADLRVSDYMSPIPTLNSVTFIKNFADSEGGALCSRGITIDRSTFLANHAEGSGGAMFIMGSGMENLTISNSIFDGNTAGYDAGALYIYFISALLVNNTIIHNGAPETAPSSYGGGIGIFYNAYTRLYNNLIWGNHASTGPQIYLDSVNYASAYYYNNLIQDSFDPYGTWDSSLGYDMLGNIDPDDPGLINPIGPDKEIGTTDDNLRLLTDSPARDAGYADPPAMPAQDHDNRPRPVGASLDIGAYELQPILYVKPSATGTGDGSSWENAFTDLSLALDYARSVESDINQISVWVAEGTYRPAVTTTPPADLRELTFDLGAFTSIYGGFVGTETHISQRDLLLHQTILDGDLNGDDVGFTNNGENSYHVLHTSASSTIVTIDGLVIRGGNANHPTNGYYSKGGGLRAENGLPFLRNILFVENNALMGGGAALGDMGMGGAQLQNEDMAVMELERGINNVAFRDNRADWGGGMWTCEVNSTLNRVGFFNNQANVGGGIYNCSPLNLFSVVFKENHSNTSGGAIYSQFSGLLDVVNATFEGNSSPQGGALTLPIGSMEVKNSIFWNNPSDGGLPVQIGPSPANAIFYSSLVQGTGGSGAWNPAQGEDGGVNIDLDPLFAGPGLRLSFISPAVDQGNNGYILPEIQRDYAGNPRILAGVVDMGAFEAVRPNTTWPTAATGMEPTAPTALLASGETTVSLSQYLSVAGQSRWYKVPIEPDTRLTIALTNLPANYDLTVYKNIPDAFKEILSAEDMTELDAEFAPDMYSPDMYSPDMYSPDMYSPDMYSPDMFSPDMYSPDMYSPDMYSPDMYSPDMYSPDMYSPDMYSPDMYSPDMYSPDMYSPDMYSPDVFAPGMTPEEVQQAFSSAQLRSLVGISAMEGTSNENLAVNTWNNTGFYYIRVNGRNGAFDAENPFQLSITRLTGQCSGLVLDPGLSGGLSAQSGNFETLVLVDWNRLVTQNAAAGDAGFQARVSSFASGVNGVLVDVGQDPNIAALNEQADTRNACPFAKNLVANAIRKLVRAYREQNGELQYLVLVGNDNIIPFFRHPDFAQIGSESNYVPPVQNDTASQASLKSNYFLSQDDYGARVEISYKTDVLPIPDLAVGRLVETPAEIDSQLIAFNDGGGQLAAPTTALVTGYDFLADAATKVSNQLSLGMGPAAVVDELISARETAPSESWTADDLRTALLGSRHDIIFLAGHFSAGGTLAADTVTRMTATELSESGVDLKNSLVYSAGCHSGYNLVNEHGFAGISPEPDWAQAFAGKGATLVAGTGYQYGDTDFVEYSERLYFEFTRQLRAGTGAVRVGKALVTAKQVYLSDTPELRGIHVKALLEATLFGLPMVSINMPGERYAPPSSTSIVPDPIPYTTNPGMTLGLRYADVTIDTDKLKEVDVTLKGIGDPPPTYVATYLEGTSGVKVNPFEPVLPLEVRNISNPIPGWNGVLRGVGWRGGTYTEQNNVLPLTGAASTEIRGVHTPFYSNIFYPIRPWSVNYFDGLSGLAAGRSMLALTPAQYRSEPVYVDTGVLRVFSQWQFRMFYSDNFAQYGEFDTVPALAGPPVISRVQSSVLEGVLLNARIYFDVEVLGDPSAGIQEVWVTYTYPTGSLSGNSWQSLDLTQHWADSRLWEGSMLLPPGVSPEDVHYVVQAVNGVGMVTLSTNMGAYYVPGFDSAEPPISQRPTSLTLEGPSSGPYGTEVVLSAMLATTRGPLDGQVVTFRLGAQQRSVVTGPTDENPKLEHGQAQVHMLLIGSVGENQAQVTFEGSPTLASSNAVLDFEILKQDTKIVIEKVEGGQYTVALLDVTGRPLSNQTLFLVSGNDAQHLLTDYTGRTTFIPESGVFNLYYNGWIPLGEESLTLYDARYNPSFSRVGFYFFLPVLMALLQ